MIRRLIVAGLGMFALTGCIPALSNPWTQAQGAGRTQIQLGETPGCDECITAPWEQMAGWDMFAEHSQSPDIEFKVRTTPIVAPNGGGRRAAYVKPTLNADGSMRHAVIWFDPAMSWQLDDGLFVHELGHAAGFIAGTDTTGSDYRGVMSYDEFWTTRSGWFGVQDVEMMAGYR